MYLPKRPARMEGRNPSCFSVCPGSGCCVQVSGRGARFRCVDPPFSVQIRRGAPHGRRALQNPRLVTLDGSTYPTASWVRQRPDRRTGSTSSTFHACTLEALSEVRSGIAVEALQATNRRSMVATLQFECQSIFHCANTAMSPFGRRRVPVGRPGGGTVAPASHWRRVAAAERLEVPEIAPNLPRTVIRPVPGTPA